MAFPVNFEEKVKAPPAINGAGYPYRISARDLMANFQYLLDRIADGGSPNDMLYWDGSKWAALSGPSGNGTFVLGCVDGTLTWMDTEECA